MFLTRFYGKPLGQRGLGHFDLNDTNPSCDTIDNPTSYRVT